MSRFKSNLDRDLKVIYGSHATLNGTAIKAPTYGGGFAVRSGNLSITGSKTGIVTGLSTVTDAVASINNGATATNYWVTARPTPSAAGQIDIYIWKPTAVADTTPIAGTAAVTVHWWATGTATTSTSQFTQTSFNYQNEPIADKNSVATKGE